MTIKKPPQTLNNFHSPLIALNEIATRPSLLIRRSSLHRINCLAKQRFHQLLTETNSDGEQVIHSKSKTQGSPSIPIHKRFSKCLTPPSSKKNCSFLNKEVSPIKLPLNIDQDPISSMIFENYPEDLDKSFCLSPDEIPQESLPQPSDEDNKRFSPTWFASLLASSTNLEKPPTTNQDMPTLNNPSFNEKTADDALVQFFHDSCNT